MNFINLNSALKDYNLKKVLLWGNFKGHFDEAVNSTGKKRIIHIGIAFVEFFPLLGQIASIFEYALVRYVYHVRIEKLRTATTSIQSIIRMSLAQQKNKQLKTTAITESAIIFQKMCRGFLSKQKLVQMGEEKNKAIVTMQSLCRSYFAKQCLNKLAKVMEVVSDDCSKPRHTIDWLRNIIHNDKCDLFEKNKDHPSNFFILHKDKGKCLNSKNMYKFQTILGSGGTKRAFLIQEVFQGSNNWKCGNIETNALILPTTNYPVTESKWKSTVQGEVAYSQWCSQFKLLTTHITKVKIQQVNGKAFPAYITPSFESLSQKGLYIIDNQHIDKSLWKHEKKSLFSFNPTPTLSLDNLEKWDSIIIPLIKDLGKLYSIFKRVDKDTINLCIQKINLNEDKTAYQARLFLFDFQNCSSRDVIECATDEEYALHKTDRDAKLLALCQEYDQEPKQAQFIKYKNSMVNSIKNLLLVEYEKSSNVTVFANALAHRHFKIFLRKVLKIFHKSFSNN